MTEFSLGLGDKELKYEGDLVALGALEIGGGKEQFYASLSYWDREDYLCQWQYGVSRILSGYKKSAIVTSMYDPSSANFIFWWVMYLIGDNVHIQNHVLFLDELIVPFDESNIYSSIPEREIITDEGERISEWIIDVSAFDPPHS